MTLILLWAVLGAVHRGDEVEGRGDVEGDVGDGDRLLATESTPRPT